MTERIKALLLDVDGTLVDSNWQHAIAWVRAFHEHGYTDVTTADVHRSIGMASDLLMTHLVGAREPEIADRHDQLMSGMTDHITAQPGAQRLLAECRDSGYETLLVTSAGEDDLEWMLPLIGGRSAVSTIVTSADIDKSKPHPEPFLSAMDKGGRAASECVVIGDSVWDMKAAVRAGIPAIGMTCGGTTASELRDAGARATYATPAELLDRMTTHGMRLFD